MMFILGIILAIVLLEFFPPLIVLLIFMISIPTSTFLYTLLELFYISYFKKLK